MQEIKSKTEGLGMSTYLECPGDANFLIGCIRGINSKNCPAAKWNKTAECEAAKTRINSEECKIKM